MARKVYKRWQINEIEDKKRQDLLADENDRYILLLSIKVSNRLINLGKEMKNLIY